MIFYCKNCDKDIVVMDSLGDGYHNWKCKACGHIANIKDSIGPRAVWKTNPGTVRPRNRR